jgi:hypothetical protein
VRIVTDDQQADDRELVENIVRLHEICTPVKVIAQKYCLREETIRFFIQRRRLSQRQLHRETLGQPSPGRGSER